jgi:uncharacterized repeat protein (TIGR03943 family)
MRLPATRVVRALALAVWAGFFDWLWLSGSWVRFVGPRTSWVVPFGALLLTLAAVLYAATCLRPEPEPRDLSLRDAAALLALLAPVLALFVVPNASLGALAVSRKSGQDVTQKPKGGNGKVGLYDIAYASHYRDWAAQHHIGPGTRVTVTGLLSDPDGPGDPGFDLARFVTTCCAADALPYHVHVRPQGVAPPGNDGWYEVTGTLEPGAGGGFQIVAAAIRSTPAPANPYDRV